MSLSLNEIVATARKAARGAGYAWSMADEAGGAAGWLCGHSQDGVGALVRLLRQVDEADPTGMRPARIRDIWRAATGEMCPLHAGVALSDRAKLLGAAPIRMADVIEPVLILPFASAAARQTGCAVSVACLGGVAVTDGELLAVTGSMRRFAEEVHVALSDAPLEPLPRTSRATPVPEDWQMLLDYAHRTYAPATDASRALGAGSGLSDND